MEIVRISYLTHTHTHTHKTYFFLRNMKNLER